MNFTEPEFWVVLALCAIPILLIRALVARFRPAVVAGFDQFALACTSLILFWFAGGTSLVIFVVELLALYLAVALTSTLEGRARKAALVGILVSMFGVLAYYKYSNFLVNDVLRLGIPIVTLAIPPGISFYTFHLSAFVIDTLGRREKTPRFMHYLNFASFFPQLVAGPIERRHKLLPQVEGLRLAPTWQTLQAGLPFVMLGLFYKTVVADNLAPFIPHGATSNPILVWVSAFLFGLRIYFDFAGYSLTAVGIARCVGIELTFNFLAPYTSRNIAEFWSRWHRTLSNWFRDYLYIPLGGNRVRHWALNIIIVFTVSGLWHGAGFNFIIWGLLHGILNVLHKLSKRSGIVLPEFLRWLGTAVIVTFTWLFFQETNTGWLVQKVAALFTPGGYTAANASLALHSVVGSARDAAPFLIAFGLGLALLVSEHLAYHDEIPYRPLTSTRMAMVCAAGLVLLAAGERSSFIYFSF